MKGKAIHYSKDERAFLRANRALKRTDLTEKFNSKFGRELSVDNIKGICQRQGWKTGRTGRFEKGGTSWNLGRKGYMKANSTSFEKGHLPHNTKYAGHERLSKDGYVEISVNQVNPHTGYERRYVLKHRWIWEQAHGPIPRGQVIKFVDGDKANITLDNLIMIPRAILPGLAKRQYDQADPKLKPLILAAVKLQHSAKVARRDSQAAPAQRGAT